MNKQLTIFLRSTLIVLLVFTVTLVQAAVPQGIMEIAGRYVGMAYNGGDLDPVVTVLSFDSQGPFFPVLIQCRMKTASLKDACRA